MIDPHGHEISFSVGCTFSPSHFLCLHPPSVPRILLFHPSFPITSPPQFSPIPSFSPPLSSPQLLPNFLPFFSLSPSYSCSFLLLQTGVPDVKTAFLCRISYPASCRKAILLTSTLTRFQSLLLLLLHHLNLLLRRCRPLPRPNATASSPKASLERQRQRQRRPPAAGATKTASGRNG